MDPSDRFDDALAYASRLHRAQKRKGTDIPYVAHLLAVCSLVIENGGSEDQAIAALLHDAAEDQGGEATLKAIEVRYGAPVAKIVADCTDSWVEPKPPWRKRKEAYLAALPSKPVSSLLVSLADKTHNAGAILNDDRLLGDDLWPRFARRSRRHDLVLQVALPHLRKGLAVRIDRHAFGDSGPVCRERSQSGPAVSTIPILATRCEFKSHFARPRTARPRIPSMPRYACSSNGRERHSVPTISSSRPTRSRSAIHW